MSAFAIRVGSLLGFIVLVLWECWKASTLLECAEKGDIGRFNDYQVNTFTCLL